jgi:arylsulfatase A-like enzyme
MLEALRAEQKAGEQKPAPKEGLIEKKYPLDEFPGPSAWISGDWKLHRVPAKNGTQINYRLYHLRRDQAEKLDLAAVQPERLVRMKAELAAWQKSVLNSLNGGDYRD